MTLRPAITCPEILLLTVLLTACAPDSYDFQTLTNARAQDASDTDEPISATRYSAEDEALHLARFNRLMDASRLARVSDLYDPLVPITGAGTLVSLPRVADGERSIKIDALEAAQHYAAEMNSNALLIWRDGGLELETYFGEHARDSLVVSGSLAKPVTAIAVGRAIALGHITSLDQPVADYIDEWQGDTLREKMQIRHLLDMRSGFLPQGTSADPQHILNRAYLHPRHDEVIIHDYPVVDEPGSRHEYSNATSELVAVVIQRATGMRYEDFVSREVLRPIGAAGGQIWLNRPGGVAHSGCCALLPAQSWMRLAMLLLDDGVWEGTRLLPEGYVAEMKTGTEQNERYGLGVYLPGRYTERRAFANLERHPELGPGVLHSEPYLADDLFMFDGNANQVVYIVPSLRLIILRTGSNPPRDNEWDNSYLPNLLIANAVLGPEETLPEPQPVAHGLIRTTPKSSGLLAGRKTALAGT